MLFNIKNYLKNNRCDTSRQAQYSLIFAATQEEAATAYGTAAIEYRGLNAVINFDLSRYIKWLKPNQNNIDNNKLLDIV